jgi:hypothetical protein
MVIQIIQKINASVELVEDAATYSSNQYCAKCVDLAAKTRSFGPRGKEGL